MQPIYVDLSTITDSLETTANQVEALKEEMLTGIVNEYKVIWNHLIDTGLTQTRSEYKKGMYETRLDEDTIELGLTKRQSKLSMMIEEGASGFDMKEGFKNSPHAERNGNNWYLTIPFRHATPTAEATSLAFATKMPTEIYDKVEGFSGNQKLKAKDLPEGFGNTKIRDAVIVPTPFKRVIKHGAYQHKNPIYEGLQKSGKKYNSSHVTFRRVSNNSAPNSWIHKGFQAHDFMGKARAGLETSMDNVIKDAVRRVFT